MFITCDGIRSEMNRITIIGAGLAGLSAAAELAKRNICCRLVSAQISERAQSVMAEGGINAALNVMGEEDSVEEHIADTLNGGVRLADPEAVRHLAEAAPEIVRHLAELGVPFAMEGERLIQRNFGGQKKKRTAFCKSSTGKALMTAMIDEVRQYEETYVFRYSHHTLAGLNITEGRCRGARIRDSYSGEIRYLEGPVILAFGGPCGLFPGMTTGTAANDGNALAAVFSEGVEAADLEFIQYHPTTAAIAGKRLLISEAARGEGGRLFIMKNGRPWYFMEEKYPELGSLMPRDVVSREIVRALADPECGDQVFLDLTALTKQVWKKKLPDLREEIRHYLGIDPAAEPVPVSPGIHYFMGGIRTDTKHRTSIKNLYAAGECACQYHGANRLGGNSLLGALYGGKTAAGTAAEELSGEGPAEQTADADREREPFREKIVPAKEAYADGRAAPEITARLGEILNKGMGILRDEETLQTALRELRDLKREAAAETDRQRLALGEAMLLSALARRESRGAHQRTDHPDTDDTEYRKQTVALFKEGTVHISFQDI